MPQPRAVTRIETQDETIEKAAAFARRTGKKTVHRRRQPDHLDQVGENTGAALRLTVDTYDPFRPTARCCRRHDTRADLDCASRTIHCRRNRPPARPDRARQIAVSSLAQPVPRCEQRHSFHQVRLARTVLPHQHDRRRTECQRHRSIVAKIGQCQPFDPETLVNGGRGFDRIHQGSMNGRYHTRIGISTYSALASLPSRTMVGDPESASLNCAVSLSSWLAISSR